MSTHQDQKFELENQFILRLPQAQANALRQAIKHGEPLSKRLFMKFESDLRHGAVKFDKWTMPARLYDLPTIIESYKTLDRKNFYKTADICQILIAKDPAPGSDATAEKDDEARKSQYDALFQSIGGTGKREFLYPHGITPPLKNVRKRRFRKTLRKKYVDFSEIEKEVKRLFKFDCEAIETRYEIVEENKTTTSHPVPFDSENANSPVPCDSGPGIQSTENSQNIGELELFGGELSDSSNDDDDDDDDEDDYDDDEDDDVKDEDLELDPDQENSQFDDDMDDDDDEDASRPAPTQQTQQSESAGPDIAAELAAASDLIAQNDDNDEKIQELERELNKIRERIEIQETEMRGLDNQALRMRLQPVLDSLHEQEEEIKAKLEELGR